MIEFETMRIEKIIVHLIVLGCMFMIDIVYGTKWGDQMTLKEKGPETTFVPLERKDMDGYNMYTTGFITQIPGKSVPSIQNEEIEDRGELVIQTEGVQLRNDVSVKEEKETAGTNGDCTDCENDGFVTISSGDASLGKVKKMIRGASLNAGGVVKVDG